ncbi:hypothetical protein B0H14DRAFT_2888321 [Mycena olivaceomarginata]|nr:hypothetical protein B0H14DRAFT_2888321 [Mycena olivaceomarginata]
MTPEDRAKIVVRCQDHKKANWKKTDYRAAIPIDNEYFVKYGDVPTLAPEAATHQYVSEYAATVAAPGTPRIPTVKSYFIHEKSAYLVLEYVELTGSIDPETTAAALKWLAGVPLPPNHTFGPLAGGHIRHRFFKDYQAPLKFSSVEAIERYIERGRTMLPTQVQGKLDVVSIIGEPSIWIQSDVHPSNFGRDALGNIYIVDFGQIAPLPKSFAAFIILSDPNLAPFAKFLGLENITNMASLRRVSHMLWMKADPTLGLNADGLLKDSR